MLPIHQVYMDYISDGMSGEFFCGLPEAYKAGPTSPVAFILLLSRLSQYGYERKRTRAPSRSWIWCWYVRGASCYVSGDLIILISCSRWCVIMRHDLTKNLMVVERDWIIFQRVHADSHCHSSPIHWLLSQKL